MLNFLISLSQFFMSLYESGFSRETEKYRMCMHTNTYTHILTCTHLGGVGKRERDKERGIRSHDRGGLANPKSVGQRLTEELQLDSNPNVVYW